VYSLGLVCTIVKINEGLIIQTKRSRLTSLQEPYFERLLVAPSAMGAGLARDLAQVVSEPIFDIPRLVEAACHQRFDPILGDGSPERSDACIPPSTELDIQGQAGVDEALGVAIAHLSNLEIRVASASTNASRSASAMARIVRIEGLSGIETHKYQGVVRQNAARRPQKIFSHGRLPTEPLRPRRLG
jgi:hypothetical protein